MKKRLILWATLALLAWLSGCAEGYKRPGTPSPYVPSYSDVPPSFYEGDPALRQWFTYPYWNPEMSSD